MTSTSHSPLRGAHSPSFSIHAAYTGSSPLCGAVAKLATVAPVGHRGRVPNVYAACMELGSCLVIESYPLTESPWIPVVMLSGEQRHLGLREIYQAERVGRLDGDLPTQDAALLRLLVAIILVSVADPDRTASSAIDDWQRWWHDWSTLNGLVQRYLEENKHRFDVLDPIVPSCRPRGWSQ